MCLILKLIDVRMSDTQTNRCQDVFDTQTNQTHPAIDQTAYIDAWKKYHKTALYKSS